MLNIAHVDPRDTAWEVDQPAYRVYFWHQQLAPPGIRQAQMGYVSDEYRLTGADDVVQVLRWAKGAARPEQTFTLYVEHLHDNGPGLIKLAGEDPTESE
jgi:hypothetical protein